MIPLSPELQAALVNPPEEDSIVRCIYANEAVKGFVVVAGKSTLRQFPRAAEYKIHFLKAEGTIRDYNNEQEYRNTQEVWDQLPNLGPVPIGFTEDTFRSEYIEGLTIRAKFAAYGLFPTSKEAIYSPCPESVLQSAWETGVNTLSAILTLHDIEKVHRDMHMEQAILRPDGNISIIDFETLRAPQSEEEYDWDLSNLKSFAKRILHSGYKPEEGPLLSLAKGAKHGDKEIISSPRLNFTSDALDV